MQNKPNPGPPPGVSFKPFSFFGVIALLTLLSAFTTLVIAARYLTQPDPTAEPLAYPFAPTLVQEPGIALLTQDCPPPELQLGERTFLVQKVALAADGSLPEPPAAADTAFWVNTSGAAHVLLLGDHAFGQDAEALQDLTQATFTRDACRVAVYQLDEPRLATAGASELLYSSTQGLSLFIQISPAGDGYLLQGQLLEEFITAQGQKTSTKAQPTAKPLDAPMLTDTPSSAYLESQPVTQAEVGLMEASAPGGGSSVQVKVYIYNFGEAPITFSLTDVSLDAEAGNTQHPAQVIPELPHLIRAGQTSTFTFTFNNPPAGWGTLRVLTTQFELADFLP